jgi:hypothetical protein
MGFLHSFSLYFSLLISFVSFSYIEYSYLLIFFYPFSRDFSSSFLFFSFLYFLYFFYPFCSFSSLVDFCSFLFSFTVVAPEKDIGEKERESSGERDLPKAEDPSLFLLPYQPREREIELRDREMENEREREREEPTVPLC